MLRARSLVDGMSTKHPVGRRETNTVLLFGTLTFTDSESEPWFLHCDFNVLAMSRQELASNLDKEGLPMALAPFWLDDVFEGGTENSVEKLRLSKRFKAAIARAEAAYLQTQDTIEQNPGICGASPEQAAREAFLESVGLCIAS